MQLWLSYSEPKCYRKCITDICIDGIKSLIELLTEFGARSWVARALVFAYVKVSRYLGVHGGGRIRIKNYKYSKEAIYLLLP